MSKDELIKELANKVDKELNAYKNHFCKCRQKKLWHIHMKQS